MIFFLNYIVTISFLLSFISIDLKMSRCSGLNNFSLTKCNVIIYLPKDESGDNTK